MAAPFDVDAVLRKWGFLRYSPSSLQPSSGTWYGDLDGKPTTVLPGEAYRFANLLLMRN